ncbi:MAG: TetR/AcrR family transcriptional regulator [Candidatus Dormibacteraeota bacterium]|nr:TetR/AcrR family transcriptional regulator [Candidatus Dormibacteraeota bacterium]
MAKHGETRQKLIHSTSVLLQRKGLNGTGMLDVLEMSGTPRGSLYFHFPGGKEQMVEAAIEAVRETVTGWIDSSDSIEEFFQRYAKRVERSSFREGCPVAAVAVEGAPQSERLRAVTASAFDAYIAAFARHLEKAGHSPSDARRLGTLVLSVFQGALVLSRAQRSCDPLRAAVANLEPALRPVAMRRRPSTAAVA